MGLGRFYATRKTKEKNTFRRHNNGLPLPLSRNMKTRRAHHRTAVAGAAPPLHVESTTTITSDTSSLSSPPSPPPPSPASPSSAALAPASWRGALVAEGLPGGGSESGGSGSSRSHASASSQSIGFRTTSGASKPNKEEEEKGSEANTGAEGNRAAFQGIKKFAHMMRKGSPVPSLLAALPTHNLSH